MYNRSIHPASIWCACVCPASGMDNLIRLEPPCHRLLCVRGCCNVFGRIQSMCSTYERVTLAVYVNGIWCMRLCMCSESVEYFEWLMPSKSNTICRVPRHCRLGRAVCVCVQRSQRLNVVILLPVRAPIPFHSHIKCHCRLYSLAFIAGPHPLAASYRRNSTATAGTCTIRAHAIGKPFASKLTSTSANRIRPTIVRSAAVSVCMRAYSSSIVTAFNNP